MIRADLLASGDGVGRAEADAALCPAVGATVLRPLAGAVALRPEAAAVTWQPATAIAASASAAARRGPGRAALIEQDSDRLILTSSTTMASASVPARQAVLISTLSGTRASYFTAELHGGL
jgi:hypothetical protein